jgi:DNA end-binding protein Ku
VAARPYWRGYLKLSLVSCPIALYPAASSSERIAFRQINKKTGNRLRQQLVDDVTPVESEDKAKGYEYAKNTYLVIDDEELEALRIDSSQTIEIDRFVPRAQIDERYLESPYYIIPDDKVGQEAFAVVREAMRDKKMVALARVVLAKHEHVIMLQPWDKGLMGTTLRYPYEIRDYKQLFDEIADVKVAPDVLKLADHIVESKKGDFDPSQFVDHYEEAVVELIRRKRAGLPAESQKVSPTAPNVVSLMDALRRSLAEEKGVKPAAAKAAPKKGTKRISGQTEMLLPIAGRKEKEERNMDTRSGRIATVEQHIRLENEHDLEGVLRTFGDIAQYDDEPWGEHYKGQSGVRLFYEQLMKALPDLKIDVQRQHVAEEAIVVEVIIRGTHLGAWRGLPATGRSVEFPLCGIYTFDADDRLAGERIYYDRGTVLRQLGVFHEPASILGRLSTLAPTTIAHAVARKFLRNSTR